MATMLQISEWLSATALSQGIGLREWVVPASQSVHILAIAIVMASVAMLDMRLAGIIGREQSLRDMTRRFYPWIWGALVVLLLTGLVQVMAEPGRELLNWIFWTKMGLIVASVAVTMPVRRILEDCPYRNLDPGQRAIVRACAFLSLVLWVAVVVCGRWIAYAGGSDN